MKIKMQYKKSTKNTYVFEAQDSEVPSLYIKKTAFDKQPASITVTIEVSD